MTKTLVDCALSYEKLGFFVLPIVPKTKHPYEKWAYRKDRRPNSDEIKSWWNKHPEANVGIARQPEPKRCDPDTLPVINSGRK